jgi:hypothetical protein
MKQAVPLLAEAVRIDVGGHDLEREVHRHEVTLGPACCGQRGQLRFQRLPGLEDRRQPVPLRHQLHQMA